MARTAHTLRPIPTTTDLLAEHYLPAPPPSPVTAAYAAKELVDAHRRQIVDRHAAAVEARRARLDDLVVAALAGDRQRIATATAAAADLALEAEHLLHERDALSEASQILYVRAMSAERTDLEHRAWQERVAAIRSEWWGIMSAPHGRDWTEQQVNLERSLAGFAASLTA